MPHYARFVRDGMDRVTSLGIMCDPTNGITRGNFTENTYETPLNRWQYSEPGIPCATSWCWLFCWAFSGNAAVGNGLENNSRHALDARNVWNRIFRVRYQDIGTPQNRRTIYDSAIVCPKVWPYENAASEKILNDLLMSVLGENLFNEENTL